jgi:hypothetical protein
MRAGLNAAVIAAMLAATGATSAGQAPDLDTLLARVADRIAEYYRRAQSVVCVEQSVVQPIDANNLAPQGFARRVESELRVELDGSDDGEAKVVRQIRKVNGRPPRDKDSKDRAGCTDPNPLSIEPLSFLLPAHRGEFVFTAAGAAREKNHDTLLIDYATTSRKSSLQLRADKNDREDCYGMDGDVAVKGRVWVDAQSYDVLRVDQRFTGRVDVRVPADLQRKHQFDNFMVVDRYDLTIRYRTVAFQDPAEALLLPESVNLLFVMHGGLASTRRTQTFSDYRRFLTGGRVVK